MILRRIFAALFMLCALAVPAHAQKTKAAINTEIGVQFPDNVAGQITPLNLRNVTLDIINSIMPTAPVGAGNFACFSGTTGLLQDCGTGPSGPSFTGPLTVTSNSPNALAVGATGATNPAFQVDASVALQASGIKATGAVTGGHVALTAIDSGSNTSFDINSKGTGSVLLNNVATGSVSIATGGGGVLLGSALTYGGVTLNNAVTGTGNMVLSTSPVLTTPALGTPSALVATNATGTAAGLTAGTVTTNANLTGPVTSVGNATTIGANQVTRANEVQGVARSVVGVTGNATANVADIQLTASQFLGTTAANTSLAGVGYGPGATAAAGQLPGTATNDSATAGNVGEFVTASIAAGSAISLTSPTAANVTSISLTAGDWDIYGNILYTPGATTNVTFLEGTVGTGTATISSTNVSAYGVYGTAAQVPTAAVFLTISPMRLRVQLTTPTTYFLVARGTFTVSTLTAWGQIQARRVR